MAGSRSARSSSATLAVLTLINCLGVKLGSRVQSVLMVMKIGAIADPDCSGLVSGANILIRCCIPCSIANRRST